MTERPGVALARRPLHFFLVLDCSGSMAANGKIAALNTAVREVLPHLADTASGNPHAEVLVRAVRFGTGAGWHVLPPTPPEDLEWADVVAHGYTDLGAALDLLTQALTVPPMEERALAPAIVLVSDGMPTDAFDEPLERLLTLPWGARSVRMAVAIGHDADYDVLSRFVSPGLEPVSAANPEQLVLALRWASTRVARAASTMAPAGPPPVQITAAFTPSSPSEVVW
jgi:uncharacterized protein YegL